MKSIVPDATTDTHSKWSRPAAEAPAPTTIERDHGIVGRCLERAAERRRAQLVSPRNRRKLAQWLRHTARDASDRNRTRQPYDLLLCARAAAVRTELIEIAARLEQAQHPDPARVAAVRELLRDGTSPLYHPGVPACELRATLDYVRSGLDSSI
jgi:hypothetical protein